MPRHKKIRHRRKPTPYAKFVKAHYPKYRHLPTPQARIKAIAAAWRASRTASTTTTPENAKN